MQYNPYKNNGMMSFFYVVIEEQSLSPNSVLNGLYCDQVSPWSEIKRNMSRGDCELIISASLRKCD